MIRWRTWCPLWIWALGSVWGRKAFFFNHQHVISVTQVTLKDPLADLVSAIDLGTDLNVHPPNKWDVASRLVSCSEFNVSLKCFSKRF